MNIKLNDLVSGSGACCTWRYYVACHVNHSSFHQQLIAASRLHKGNRRLVSIFIKLRCDERFTHAFTACGCVFKEITLVGSNQGNYIENATECKKRMLKTTVATQLKLVEIPRVRGELKARGK